MWDTINVNQIYFFLSVLFCSEYENEVVSSVRSQLEIFLASLNNNSSSEDKDSSTITSDTAAATDRVDGSRKSAKPAVEKSPSVEDLAAVTSSSLEVSLASALEQQLKAFYG